MAQQEHNDAKDSGQRSQAGYDLKHERGAGADAHRSAAGGRECLLHFVEAESNRFRPLVGRDLANLANDGKLRLVVIVELPE